MKSQAETPGSVFAMLASRRTLECLGVALALAAEVLDWFVSSSVLSHCPHRFHLCLDRCVAPLLTFSSERCADQVCGIISPLLQQRAGLVLLALSPATPQLAAALSRLPVSLRVAVQVSTHDRVQAPPLDRPCCTVCRLFGGWTVCCSFRPPL